MLVGSEGLLNGLFAFSLFFSSFPLLLRSEVFCCRLRSGRQEGLQLVCLLFPCNFGGHGFLYH